MKAKLLSYYKKDSIEVGLDETGYGSAIGDLFICGVILPNDFYSEIINDSKKLTEEKRLKAREIILKNCIEYKITRINCQRIDQVGVYHARNDGFLKCLNSFKTKFNHIIVDGNTFPNYKIPYNCVVKGDSKYLSIAAASILAKTFRDEYVVNELDKEFPEYDWKTNKGYLTEKHMKKIIEIGTCKYHRQSFMNINSWRNKFQNENK